LNPRYPALLDRAEGRCEYCHGPAKTYNFAFDVDHIRPTTLGGADDPVNLAIACHSCNAFKSSLRAALDPSSAERSFDTLPLPVV